MKSIPHRKSIRLILTTNNIAELLGVHPETVRRRLRDKTLSFTGNPILDFHMLAKLCGYTPSVGEPPEHFHLLAQHYGYELRS